MTVVEELERLVRLRAEGALTPEEFARAKSQLLGARRFSGFPFKGIRRQSSRQLYGLPLWAIAIGPDWDRGEVRGHARAIFALGDMATGWFAFGGLARGLVAVGGLAFGLFAFGGGAVGVVIAVGGGAMGGVAFGGAAVGLIAIGGAVCGYYALGGAAFGVHTVSALHQDPEAVSLFRQYFPWFTKLFH